MRISVLLAILSLMAHLMCGQSYVDYYHLCNAADKDAYYKDYESALSKLESAFSLVGYVHAIQYEEASRYSNEVGDFEKALSYITKSIINGGRNEVWNGRKFQKFRKSKYYEALKDSIKFLEGKHRQSINLKYAGAVDSLYFVDQNIIRGNKRVKGGYKLDKRELPDNLFDLDSNNLASLLNLIEAYGFPSERIVSSEGYEKAIIILHHTLRLEQNAKYHPIALEAVICGDYLPRDYAAMYEQYCMRYRNRTHFTTWDKDLSADNLKRINANRSEIGLKGLSAIELKRKGLVMIAKW